MPLLNLTDEQFDWIRGKLGESLLETSRSLGVAMTQGNTDQEEFYRGRHQKLTELQEAIGKGTSQQNIGDNFGYALQDSNGDIVYFAVAHPEGYTAYPMSETGTTLEPLDHDPSILNLAQRLSQEDSVEYTIINIMVTSVFSTTREI